MNMVREKQICGKAFRYDELRENKEGIPRYNEVYTETLNIP